MYPKVIANVYPMATASQFHPSAHPAFLENALRLYPKDRRSPIHAPATMVPGAMAFRARNQAARAAWAVDTRDCSRMLAWLLPARAPCSHAPLAGSASAPPAARAAVSTTLPYRPLSPPPPSPCPHQLHLLAAKLSAATLKCRHGADNTSALSVRHGTSPTTQPLLHRVYQELFRSCNHKRKAVPLPPHPTPPHGTYPALRDCQPHFSPLQHPPHRGDTTWHAMHPARDSTPALHYRNRDCIPHPSSTRDSVLLHVTLLLYEWKARSWLRTYGGCVEIVAIIVVTS